MEATRLYDHINAEPAVRIGAEQVTRCVLGEPCVVTLIGWDLADNSSVAVLDHGQPCGANFSHLAGLEVEASRRSPARRRQCRSHRPAPRRHGRLLLLQQTSLHGDQPNQ